MTKKGALANSPRRVAKRPAEAPAKTATPEPPGDAAPETEKDSAAPDTAATELPERPARAPRHARAERPERAERAERPEQREQPGQREQPEEAVAEPADGQSRAPVVATLEVAQLEQAGEIFESIGGESLQDITFESFQDIVPAAFVDPAEEARLADATRRIEQLLSDGSIRVAFQPIIDLATKAVIGYEALARFPGNASISTRTWFAEAAEVGLLREIEMSAIRAALAQLEKLPADAFISVNVSPLTAASDELRLVLEEVDGSRVVLEITENAAAEGYDEVSDAVGALRANGVRIALDDTGSGTVSFSSLFDVHADIIKIDIDVTRGIDCDPMKEAMASALKSLADRLGAMSLAEGIETEQELERFARGRRSGRPGLSLRPSRTSLRVTPARSTSRSSFR